MSVSRLHLVPVGPALADDLWLVHADDAVWPWYGAERPRREQVHATAAAMGRAWQRHGVHKWIAYDRADGRVVGRGGLSRPPADDDWGQLHAFLPDAAWVREVHPTGDVPAHWLELGWAVRGAFQGRGHATGIGRAGLSHAFDVLAAKAVVSCTTRHNAASRAVMDRIGMRCAGEIRTRGVVPDGGVRDDAPHTVHVLLREEWFSPAAAPP